MRFSMIVSPSPDKYEVKIGFDSLICSSKNNSHNKSFCFATGREAYDRVFMPGKANQPDPVVPGPGSYYFQKNIGHDRMKVSLKSRIKTGDPIEIEKRKNVPGPGNYQNTLQIDKLGRYAVSTY